jgi:glycine cleavage system H protein
MNIPKDLVYTKDHEWIRIDEELAVVGITDYAQSELGDIVYVELPEIGTEINQGDSFGTIEAVKAVSDLYMPLTGEVIEVNESLNNNPEIINKDPYIEGWMIKIKFSDLTEREELLDNNKYENLIKQ